jgi:hypothetical protein
MGMIPVGYAPSSVVLDTADAVLLVANDKGIGATGFGVAPPPTNTAENSYGKEEGVVSFNTHQDLGTVSIVPVPNYLTLAAMTQTVFENNHWDLSGNIASAAGGNPSAAPVAIPEKIGAPSKIQHVFVIIRENRTYDQILGDVVGGNGEPSLAVFGDNSTFAEYPVVTPNAHAMVRRLARVVHPLHYRLLSPTAASQPGPSSPTTHWKLRTRPGPTRAAYPSAMPQIAGGKSATPTAGSREVLLGKCRTALRADYARSLSEVPRRIRFGFAPGYSQGPGLCRQRPRAVPPALY